MSIHRRAAATCMNHVIKRIEKKAKDTAKKLMNTLKKQQQHQQLLKKRSDEIKELNLHLLDAPGIAEIKQVNLHQKHGKFIPATYHKSTCPKPPDEMIERIKSNRQSKAKKRLDKLSAKKELGEMSTVVVKKGVAVEEREDKNSCCKKCLQARSEILKKRYYKKNGGACIYVTNPSFVNYSPNFIKIHIFNFFNPSV